MDNFERDCGHQSGRFSATVADSNPMMEASAPWRQSVDSTIGDVFPQCTGRRQSSVQSFSVHQAVETEEAQDEYDLFAITRSLDWYEADEQAMPSEALLKPEEPEFTGPLGRMYLNSAAEEYQSSSDTSIGPVEHMGAPSFMMSSPSASNAILPCGASPAAHLLGSRKTSGDLQFLMDTEGDHCTPTGLLDGSAIHKPASSNSIVDDCHVLYPATPPQNIIGKRDWMDPYHASPQESATSMFSSSHSSVDTMHLLADVPDVLDAPFAVRDIHLPYDFDRHPINAVRYDSLHSCAGLDDLAPDEVLAGIEPLCAPAAPLGMCYAPMPAHHARSRAAASPAGKPGAPPAPAAAPAASEPAESEGRLGVRQRACKRKIKYSDSEPPLSTASDGPRSLVTSARGRCSKPRRFFSAGTESDEEVSEGSNKRRKHHNPWSVEETEALVVGVERCGGGKWADIKKLGFPVIAQRSAVDLKDKWRNLMRVALLPGTAAKTKIEKRREVPQDLLDRVRVLSANFGSKASASARPYLGRPRRSL
ncbi:probable telomere repeat-binding protein 6 at C-terminar half [Coccomyxa sp. Obi]|nr:probable telomere repeat-binding protein 6 at C-terminar half [Coccomyxa sp. Obi]